MLGAEKLADPAPLPGLQMWGDGWGVGFWGAGEEDEEDQGRPAGPVRVCLLPPPGGPSSPCPGTLAICWGEGDRNQGVLLFRHLDMRT